MPGCPMPKPKRGDLEVAAREFLSDWRKGDFCLPSLAARDAEAIEMALLRAPQESDLFEACRALKSAFGDPMTRRALGGHNEAQQEAVLKASAAIAARGQEKEKP